MIITVDTDVVVLVLSKFHKLAKHGLNSLWIEYGTGNNRRWIPMQDYAQKNW